MKVTHVMMYISLICSMIFLGCSGNNSMGEGKSNELETRIRNDYLVHLHSQGETELVLSDIKILKIYGNFNGVVVVRFDRPAWEAITSIEIGGVDLVFNNSNVPIVWHGGQFLGLVEAYDGDLLSTSDLSIIAKGSVK